MEPVISLLVLSTLPQLVVPAAPFVTSFRAVIEVVSGNSRIFSTESVRLRCSVPDDPRTSWNILWFRGSEQLSETGEELRLWNANVKQSGKFSCQGVRDTLVGDIKTLRSLPIEISVDGGWAILQVPPHPGLVGDTLNVTCRVRGNPPLHEMILYKDGVEVMRQNGDHTHFYLTNLTLEDQGMYSCRASWDLRKYTHSVISATTRVQILEVLTKPVLEIDANNDLIQVNMMKLICRVQYNARAPAPPVHYYFYKDNKKLGTATSENNDLVKRAPGQYSCKAKVPELGLSRLSTPKRFGQIPGPRMMAPPYLRPRYQWPLAPPVSSPRHSLLPVARTTAAKLATATPTFIQHAKDTTLKPSQSEPSTLLPTEQTVNQITTPESVSVTQEPYDLSAESDDMTEHNVP